MKRINWNYSILVEGWFGTIVFMKRINWNYCIHADGRFGTIVFMWKDGLELLYPCGGMVWNYNIHELEWFKDQLYLIVRRYLKEDGYKE